MEIIKPLPKRKMPKGRKPNHSEDHYLAMAKEVVDGRLTFRAAGLKYNCSHGTVNHWTSLYRKGLLVERVAKQNEDYSKSEEQLIRQNEYIRELKMQVGELYLENQLLKKAQGYFQRRKNAISSVITSENLDQFKEGAK